MAERPCTAGHISIHAPRTGSDARAAEYPAAPSSFQSTLPARGATACGKRRNARMDYFNPRSPHGERREVLDGLWIVRKFQSTLPARGATADSWKFEWVERISIHAPRTGSDERCAIFLQKSRNFNPRSPHGERRRSSRKAFSLKKFQSTLPARGATPLQPVKSTKSRFQSTLPARGATNEEMQRVRQKAFQSTLPARGATGAAGCESRHRKISIHAPRTGSDASYCGIIYV